MKKSGLYPQIFHFGVVPPEDGGLSLTPVEYVVRGFRNMEDTLVLEVAGVDQVVFYGMRTNNYGAVHGMMMSHFPQAVMTENVRRLVDGSYIGDQEDADLRRGDWLFLNEGELAMVQTLYLEYEPYLPIRAVEEREVRESGIDPLAGVVGMLANNTTGEGIDGRGSDRFGIRLVLRPADERWGQKWQNRMQDRRDGEDRRRHLQNGEGPGFGTLFALAAGGGLLFGNYTLWQNDMVNWMVPLNGGVLAAGTLFSVLKYKAGGRRKRRPYMDEQRVEDKLRSLSYHCELQIVRVYHNQFDRDRMLGQVRGLVDTLRGFDNTAGNAWKLGRLYEYDGQDIFGGAVNHPFRGGIKEVGMLSPPRADDCILSAREVASVWHLPLGTAELASMERASTVTLLPYTPELNKGGAGGGPMVGKSNRGTMEVYLPESAIARHTLILGKSGTGKSTTLKHILRYKFEQKALGRDDDAIVVIDPHSDLVHELMELVPLEIVDKVRLLDFGRMDRVPGMNLVDPKLFPDRDRCVDTIIQTVRSLWEHWGGRLEDLMRRSLTMVYEFNEHPETPPEGMLTMLDVLPILAGGDRVGQGRDTRFELSAFQRNVLSRVRDPRLHQFMEDFLKWDPSERAQAVAPVNSRIGYYAQNLRSSVVMGQRKSTIVMSDVLEQGQIVLVASASGAVGKQPAALMGGTIVSLVDSALRAQESLPASQRKHCFLACDEFQTVTGADWESMLAEDRKYGGAFMLATQSLVRLETGERRLKEGVLGNIGCFLAYKMSADDAAIVSREMNAERVEPRVFVMLDPHNCYVKVDSDTKSFPAFSMKSVPPPRNDANAEEAVRRIIEGSVAYTVDWEESRARIIADVEAQMEMDGIGGSGRKVSFGTESVAPRGGGKNGGGDDGGGPAVAVAERPGGGGPGGEGAGSGGDSGDLGGEEDRGEAGVGEEVGAAPVVVGVGNGNGEGEAPAGEAPVFEPERMVNGADPSGEGLVATGRWEQVSQALVERAGSGGAGNGHGDGEVDAGSGVARGGWPGGGWLPDAVREEVMDNYDTLAGMGGGGDLFGGEGAFEEEEEMTLEELDEAAARARAARGDNAVAEDSGEGAEEVAGEDSGEVEGREGAYDGNGAGEAEERDRRGGGRGKQPAFNSFGRATAPVVGEDSSLRGVEASAIERSRFAVDALEQIAENGDDPGVQAVFDKIFKGKHRSEMEKQYKRGRREALEEMRKEAEEAAEATGPGRGASGGGGDKGGSARERRKELLDDVVDSVIGGGQGS